MGKNVWNIKRHLTIVFTAIVFVVILLYGFSSLSIKYWKKVISEKKELLVLSEAIQNWKVPLVAIKNIWNRIQDRATQKREKSGEKSGFIPPAWFINYIHLNNNNDVISSDIKDDVSYSLVQNIISDSDYSMTQDEGFLISKINLVSGESLIILKKLDYSFSNYLWDLFDFVFVGLFFSILVYFIWKIFVDRAFVPVEENMKNMKNFIHNAGHELKTPLSVVDSNLQLIDDIWKYDKEMTKEMKHEVRKLNSLIDSLIELSDISITKKVSKIGLKEIVEEIVADRKREIKKMDISLDINIPDDVKINANKNYLYIFLSNLIGNAIKYNNKKGSVNISYLSWKLHIKDTGIWISRDNLDKIFDRFFKVDKSRWTEWFGIGLSLVWKIADIYNWKLDVESEEWKGSEFVVSF